MFTSEINTEEFTILPITERDNDCWSANILYDGEMLHLQSPPLLVTFDLNDYKYPGTSKVKFSITCTLDKTTPNVNEFVRLLEFIDTNAENSFPEKVKGLNYISSIKKDKNGKFDPTIRFKLVSNKNRFKCKILENGNEVSDNINSVKSKLIKGTKIRLIIQLNPIWKVKNNYGVSFQALAINIIKVKTNFRKEFASPIEVKMEKKEEKKMKKKILKKVKPWVTNKEIEEEKEEKIWNLKE